MAASLPAEPVPDPQPRPIRKWAGGKGRLLEALLPLLPAAKARQKVRVYVEPFFGGGAFFFRGAALFPSLKEVWLGDANPDLISLYRSVALSPDAVSAGLKRLVAAYRKKSEEERKDYFLQVRARFNKARASSTLEAEPDPKRAAEFLFLNRTCYNGLYRVNSRGEFNVPFGRYVNPGFPDAAALQALSHGFKRLRVRWHCGDFFDLIGEAGKGAFIYYDPPYRPVSPTANFTAYARDGFGEADQLRLAKAFAEADGRGALQMLSNSDPGDGFFEKAYAGFQPFHKVMAPRAISRNGSERNPVPEWVILNYRT